MCGIVGFSGHFDPTLLERMSESMAHRGPDDCGIFCQPENRIGLAHRRLAIIDLSHRSFQPMWDSTRSVDGVYNGELYNYETLRAQGALPDVADPHLAASSRAG
jgi:asparagine synthase (glutamine-hydrolysing)